MNLTTLANQCGSDKGTVHMHPHKYTYLYDLLFYPLRDAAITFVEMGLAVGGPEVGRSADREATSPSVRMWQAYFSRAKIIGFDISDFSHQVDERFSFVRGDSGSVNDLLRLAFMAPSFDVVLDDASHASYHQQLALKTLWSKLPSGGLYIIEDLHWQSPFFEDKLPPVPKTGAFLNAWFERGEYVANELWSEADMRALSEEVFSYACFTPFGEGSGPKLAVLRRR